MEEEDKKQEQGFIKEQTSKLKEKGKEEAKKRATKKIISTVITQVVIILKTFAIPIMIVLIVVTLFAGFSKVLDINLVTKASAAKSESINYSLTKRTEATDSSKDAGEINIIYDNGVYIISSNYNNEDIKNIKNEISKTGIDVSDFTDFEIGIIGALMENGLDIDDYTTEELKCLPLFIKTEACTQYLDLRLNSEKFDSEGNYQPQKLENLKENEFPGVILVQRTNTSEENPRPLEYIDLNSFNNMKAQSDLNVLNYFTIDENNNLLVAKWERTTVEVSGEYPNSIEGTREKDEYIIDIEQIPYSEYVKQYTMPFDFLMQLLVITDEAEFCTELTNIVVDSKIIINVQEEETKTVTQDIQTYTIYSKEETIKSTDIDEQEDMPSQNNQETVSSKETSETKTVTEITTNISHTYSCEILEADTWIAHYLKKYKKSEKEVLPKRIEEVNIPGEYGEPTITEETKEYKKIDVKHTTTVSIEKYPSDPNPTKNTDIYAKDENGNFEKFLLVYDKYEYTRAMMDSTSSWLFEMMEENENTTDLVDPIKGLLYEYDGTDRGVTEIDTSIFEPTKFEFNSESTAEWWWPIGSKDTEEKDGVKYASGNPVQTNITSGVGPRWGTTHNGIDIAGDRYTNIIAAKSGEVINVLDKYDDGYYKCPDGGGYGNYVRVRLDDGKTVIYAHLQKGTITVKKGDNVKQGQVIGQMGTSGSSTEVCLHFEIRDASDNALDPEEYVSPNDPRPSDSAIRKWLWNIEGGMEHINGKEWTVFDPDGPDDTMNLAHGMVIAEKDGGDSWYPKIIPGPVHVGDIVTEEQANEIWAIKIKGFKDAIDSACVKYNVTLTSYQKNALVSNIYRTGYSKGQADKLVSAYASGGNAGLWNCMKNTYNAQYEIGTKIRIAEEYELFVKGDYNYNPPTYSNTTKYDKFCNNPDI